jgi:hypothetical protein
MSGAGEPYVLAIHKALPPNMERPTEEELRKRISEHLQHHSGSTEVALIWHGYIAALLEWSLITPDTHSRLNQLLPDVGRTELMELFLGLDSE